MRANASSSRPEGYTVHVHARTLFKVVLNPAVVLGNAYTPSRPLQAQLQEMWKARKPHRIGILSEAMAQEILEDGALEYDKQYWTLTCVPIREFAPAGLWKPVGGEHCDDLMTTASSGMRRMYFVTEVKGTTLRRGIPRTNIAKIYYQLPPTRQSLCEKLSGCTEDMVGGISVEIEHLRREITVNVLAPDSNLIA